VSAAARSRPAHLRPVICCFELNMMQRTVLHTLVLSLGSMGGLLLAQTGTAVPSLVAYDSFVASLMSQYNIPGASLVLTLNGRLIMARGYGYTDAQKTKPVQPDSMFRVASLSKFITAVSIMKLVDQGKINLDAPAFALIPDLQPLAGAAVDPRLKDITVRHLLNHSGGWDRGKTPGGYDPMFLSASGRHRKIGHEPRAIHWRNRPPLRRNRPLHATGSGFPGVAWRAK
jgi:CubicO group peptidase (beta-lactamase class C family)